VFRRINFANATPDELEQLTQACEVEAFDPAYYKAGKMEPECFSSSLDPFRTDLIKIIRGYLLEGQESTKNVDIEIYKLNTYSAHLIFIRPYLILYCCPGKGSSFKPHVKTPRGKKMFGSLVIIFPTHHEGGALSLRHRGHEWIFDPSQALASGALDRPSIGYVAYLNDIKQGVAPVTSGHCVTLTYNLYFNDDGGHVSEKAAVSKHLIPPKSPNQDGFLKAFKELLENPEFMADGGTLAFGLMNVYPVQHDLKPVYLTGSDTVVYQCVRALGFEPMLYMYYNEVFDLHEGLIIDKVVTFHERFLEDEDPELDCEVLQEEGGIIVRQFGEISDYDHTEPIECVTPMTTYNRRERNEEACMIVRIGKVGDRLAYPRVAQIKKAYKQSGFHSRVYI
jgi:hypothetical protein